MEVSDKINPEQIDKQDVQDSSIHLAEVLDHFLQPDPQTLVSGALDEAKIKALAKAGVEHIINLQPESELTFDERQAVESAGMTYSHLPIAGAEDLVQLKVMEFDKILRQHQNKKILIHCKSGNRVGAMVALRQGWLRGRKMDTAMERGEAHGLAGLKDEVYKRLLVPR